MNVRTRVFVAVSASAVPAILAASTAIYALVYDNSQGEAFDTVTGVYRYYYLLKTFIIVFGVIFVPMLSALSAVAFSIFLIGKIKKRGSK